MAIVPPLLTGANSSRYSLSTPVNTMIEQLMVEDWSKNVSFASYYAACNPQYCTYSVTKRRAIIFIVTILLSLFGGLNVGLKLFTSVFIRMTNWFKSHSERKFFTVWSSFTDFYVNLSFYRSWSKLHSSRTRNSRSFYPIEFILSSIQIFTVDIEKWTIFNTIVFGFNHCRYLGFVVLLCIDRINNHHHYFQSEWKNFWNFTKIKRWVIAPLSV